MKCHIVHDLIPSHLYQMCSEETKQFMEDPLKEYSEYHKLVKDLKISNEEFECQIIDKKGFKKMKKTTSNYGDTHYYFYCLERD